MTMQLAIDGNTLTNQPSSYRDEPVQANTVRGVDGSYTAFSPSKGRKLHVTWGVDVAVTAVLDELRTARGGAAEHTLAWVDEDGDAQSMDAIWPGNPTYEQLPSTLVRNFTITFYEA